MRFNYLKALFLMGFCIVAIAAAKQTHNTGQGLGLGFKLPKKLKVSSEWLPLLNPKTTVFWKDVNGHLPDPGALLFFKNPTEDNAKLYLIRMNIKRNKSRLFQRVIAKANLELIRDGIIADDYGFAESSSDKKQKVSLHDLKEATKNTTIFFFFTPSCPHCKTQAKVLKGLDNVFPLQVGGKKLLNFEGIQRSDFAKEEDKNKFLKEGKIPTLLFVNNKINKITTISGVLTKEGIIEVAKKLNSGGSKK
jgi:thiol-disulfide isomerase/thioredoxin